MSIKAFAKKKKDLETKFKEQFKELQELDFERKEAFSTVLEYNNMRWNKMTSTERGALLNAINEVYGNEDEI